jgi:hypothetical protein
MKLMERVGLFFTLFLLIGVRTVSAAPPPEGLVAQWQLNAKNFSGIGDQMTVSDAGIPAGNSPVSLSVRFRTASSYNLNNYAVAFFYGTKTTGQGIYLGVGYDANIPQNSFFVGPHGNALGTGVMVNDNNWHRATATFDGSSWKLYLDGNLKGVKNMYTNVVKTGSANIGGTGSFYWNGSLDDVYVWNRELSAAEVAAIDEGVFITGINDVYKIKTGETLTLAPQCYSSADGQVPILPVTITPVLTDGGTIRTVNFTCLSAAKTVKVVIFRDFSSLTKFPGNGQPIIPYRTHNWNYYGQDTVYFTDDLKLGGKYYALSNSNDSSLGTWDKLTLYSF